MNRVALLGVTMFICFYMDSIFFPLVNFYDICPDMMLAASICIAILSGSVSGARFGVIGGLVMDIAVGRFLGLNGAMYMSVGYLAGFFYKKYYADNIIFPAVASSAACFLKDNFLAAISALTGTKFVYTSVLLTYIVPCALITGAAAFLMYVILKPLFTSIVNKSQQERVTN